MENKSLHFVTVVDAFDSNGHRTVSQGALGLSEHPSRVGVDKLSEYLNKFLPLEKLKSSPPLLLSPVDITLVHKVLDQKKEGPSPGMDGVFAKVYKTFESFFVPLMHQTYFYLLGGGLLDSAWSIGVLINIPKGSFTYSIAKLRPLTLENVTLKWICTILLL